LEKGTQATSFDYRPYGTELSLCQRYYQLMQGINGSGENSTNVTMSLSYKTEMRATPTIGETSVAKISENGADKTQSSIAISTPSATTRGALINMGNFTGITQYRPYFWNDNSGSPWAITLSAEL